MAELSRKSRASFESAGISGQMNRLSDMTPRRSGSRDRVLSPTDVSTYSRVFDGIEAVRTVVSASVGGKKVSWS